MSKAILHIFGYGEAQIISEKTNFKTSADELNKLQAVIDDVKASKPKEATSADHHTINIFVGRKAHFIAKKPKNAKPNGENKGTFTVNYDELDGKKVDALVAELTALSKA